MSQHFSGVQRILLRTTAFAVLLTTFGQTDGFSQTSVAPSVGPSIPLPDDYNPDSFTGGIQDIAPPRPGEPDSFLPADEYGTQSPYPSEYGGSPGGPAAQSDSYGIPAAELNDDIWAIHDPASTLVVDHSAWTQFLCKYVRTDRKGLNRVAYGDVCCHDRQRLRRYLWQLQHTDVRTLNRPEQLAFWLNLYNARTVALIVDEYPVWSIRQIKSDLFDFIGPFDDKRLCVLGRRLSLSDVENGIIRPIFNDPRIHYALNCASIGCPNLKKSAWTSACLDHDLNCAARRFINSNRGVKRCLLGVQTSRIYKWYQSDFGGSDKAVLNHIRRYANRETCQKLRGQTEILHYFYDWTLNEVGRWSSPLGKILP